MKVIAFAATNSRKSINKQLVSYAASLVPNAEVELIDINDYELPIYSIDLEEQLGVPNAAQAFLDKIATADALVISLAEHNGNYTVAFKNLFDWASRLNREVYQHKPTVLLATAPGPGGGINVLKLAEHSAQFFGGNVVASLAVPKFYENFDSEQGRLSNAGLKVQLEQAMLLLANAGEDVEA